MPTTVWVWLENLTIKNKNMTPREFRQDKEFEFDHFFELTSTGIKPNYVNIELFAQEYHKAKLNLLTIPVVSGMFSAEDVAEAFIDGQDYGMGNSDCKFNIENYR